ncbi:hypothetical protein CO230_01610 [Chryseobacterium sp. 6424]|nr:hypothetical protein CO230_01610 [Chryseobacterium sp. 6424]
MTNWVGQKGVRQTGWTNWTLQAERDFSSGDSFRMTNWVGQKGGTTGWTNWTLQAERDFSSGDSCRMTNWVGQIGRYKLNGTKEATKAVEILAE